MITGFGTPASAIIDHPIAGIGARHRRAADRDNAAAQIGNVISAAIAKAMGTAPAASAARVVAADEPTSAWPRVTLLGAGGVDLEHVPDARSA